MKDHWEKVHSTKTSKEVSWTQEYPHTAINYLKKLDLPKSSAIIDVGGGSGNFADAALELGFTAISVLDISAAALAESQKRLGANASKVKWIVSDIVKYEPMQQFDFWYDRAVFHFLTKPSDIESYVNLVSNSINSNGHFLLGTFSKNGPQKCSGLKISQYSAFEMEETFQKDFKSLECFTEVHITPFETAQDFQYCGFQRK